MVDLSSLEEYQRREATWGRLPSDPFTGVPFTADSKALPCPLLKTRIDQLILRRGGRPGVCGGKEGGATLGPQASRLIPQTLALAQTPKPPQVPESAPRSRTSHAPPSCPPGNAAVDTHTSTFTNGAPSYQGLGGGGGGTPALRRKRGLDAPTPDVDEQRDGRSEADRTSPRAENTLEPRKRTRADQQTHSTGEVLI